MADIATVSVFLQMILLQLGIIATLKESIEYVFEINLSIDLVAIIIFRIGALINSAIVEILQFDGE